MLAFFFFHDLPGLQYLVSYAGPQEYGDEELANLFQEFGRTQLSTKVFIEQQNYRPEPVNVSVSIGETVKPVAVLQIQNVKLFPVVWSSVTTSRPPPIDNVHPPRPVPPQISSPRLALPGSGDDRDSESVAESCPCPPGSAARPTDDGHRGLLVGAVCGGGDDDGCSSCVEGDGRIYQLQLQEYGDDGEAEATVEDHVWWWTHLPAASRGVPACRSRRPGHLQLRPEAEDPKSAAARQEDDRKFWEDCLASGYP
ncbi:hypothetical protein GUJ93_ZPchr0013g37887 [Zizania palustris]|uniref:RRM domain-containing protein n=1 Tax=Zizania palustris TaxID=103762 RepID=A0A8J5WXQ9_ZIZPA|nr:hypothetical protein GUJ93_ZPchr0013g37887 [Zizania palustris]